MSEDGLEYIRRYYHVPAFAGSHIRYTGGTDPVNYVIECADGARLVARPIDQFGTPDYTADVVRFHPTWGIQYIDDIEAAPDAFGDLVRAFIEAAPLIEDLTEAINRVAQAIENRRKDGGKKA
jgi:hypothetical protein